MFIVPPEVFIVYYNLYFYFSFDCNNKEPILGFISCNFEMFGHFQFFTNTYLHFMYIKDIIAVIYDENKNHTLNLLFNNININ